MSFSRRKFLSLAGVTAAGVTVVSPLEAFYARVARGQVATGIGFGALEPKLAVNADELPIIQIDGRPVDLSKTEILQLPPGFN